MARGHRLAVVAVLVASLGPAAAIAHNGFGAGVEHRTHVVLGPRAIDIEVRLVFHELAGLEVRRRIDADGDGRIDDAEARGHAGVKARELERQVSLDLGGRRLVLVTRFEPEIDLAGERRVAPGFLDLFWRAFAPLPEGLGPKAEGWLVDRSLEHLPSIDSLTWEAEGGMTGSVVPFPGGRGARVLVRFPPAVGVGAGAAPPGESGWPADMPPGLVPEFESVYQAHDFVREIGAAVAVAEALLEDGRTLLGDRTRESVEDAHRKVRYGHRMLSRETAVPGRPGPDDPIPPPPPTRDELRKMRDRLGPPIARGLVDLAAVLDGLPRFDVTLRDGKAVLEGGGPAALPGDTGLAVIRIREDGAPGAVRFEAVTSNGASPVEIHPRAPITWAVVDLKGARPGAWPLALSLAGRDRDPITVEVPVKVPEKGRIEISIVDGPGGPAVPAMVSPVWEATGAETAPEDPLDLTSQWDGQGKRGPLRRLRLERDLSVAWWCVDGKVRLDANPGAWRILIRRGNEYIPVEERLEVPSGGKMERTIALRRWVDSRALGWVSGDDHVHARVLSDADAGRVLRWARAEDVRVVNVVKMGDIRRTYFEQRGFGLAFRAEEGGSVLVPGQECPRTDEIGHTLALNLSTGMVRDTARYYLYDFMFDGARAQGALTGYAHVASGEFHVDRDMSVNVPKGKVDFIELLQFAHLDPALYYDFLNLGMRLTASAGSDVPWGGSIGEVRTYGRCPKDLAGAAAADAWFDSLRRGRTFVTNGPMVELDAEGAGPGDEVHRAKGDRVRIRARAWGHERIGAPKVLRIVRLGEIAAEAAAREGETEVRAEVEIPAKGGFWAAAHVLARDGTQAHTSPVWVIEEGLRPWKHEAVGEILARRRASLEEIAKVHEERRGKPDDPIVKEWPEIEKRIAEARRIYDGLEALAEREKKLR